MMERPYTDNDSTIRIYVACLAAYNNGILHGRWIDATNSVDDIWEEVQAMLTSSPIEDAEEWAIHDYEGFGRIRLSEYSGFEEVYSIACFLEEHDSLGEYVLDYTDGDVERATQMLDEQYYGVFASAEEFARELTQDTTTIPDHLANYIDYAAIARDMELNSDIFTIETGWEEVHIFWDQ